MSSCEPPSLPLYPSGVSVHGVLWAPAAVAGQPPGAAPERGLLRLHAQRGQRLLRRGRVRHLLPSVLKGIPNRGHDHGSVHVRLRDHEGFWWEYFSLQEWPEIRTEPEPWRRENRHSLSVRVAGKSILALLSSIKSKVMLWCLLWRSCMSKLHNDAFQRSSGFSLRNSVLKCKDGPSVMFDFKKQLYVSWMIVWCFAEGFLVLSWRNTARFRWSQSPECAWLLRTAEEQRVWVWWVTTQSAVCVASWKVKGCCVGGWECSSRGADLKVACNNIQA